MIQTLYNAIYLYCTYGVRFVGWVIGLQQRRVKSKRTRHNTCIVIDLNGRSSMYTNKKRGNERKPDHECPACRDETKVAQ